MAYTVRLDEECSEPLCSKRATLEVRNNRNEPIRRCCERHGFLLATELTKQGS